MHHASSTGTYTQAFQQVNVPVQLLQQKDAGRYRTQVPHAGTARTRTQVHGCTRGTLSWTIRTENASSCGVVGSQ